MSWAVTGRDEELSRLAAFLAALPTGPGIFLMEGEPGIGKSTLWAAGRERAAERRFSVLTARPTEGEVQIPFAGLGDLLGDLEPRYFSELPPPQEAALEVALLRRGGAGPPPLPRAIAMGLLGVLHALARETVVLLAIDDLQWLDCSSSQALSFAIRRASSPIGLLATRRVGPEPFSDDLAHAIDRERATVIRLGPMGSGAIGRIVRSHVGMALPRSLVLQIERATGGNPFFALEVARALIRRGTMPAAGEPLPVPRNLRELVRERLVRLPDRVRSAVLVTAVLSTPWATSVEEAVREGEGPSPLPEALEEGVIELEGDLVRLTHPLLGSVLYSETPPGKRHELHRRIAAVVDDAEERARHLALSARGPDASVALAVDDAAARARARGAPAAAADLYEQARRLTPNDLVEDRCRRGLRAGEAHAEAGDLGPAVDRLRAVAEEAPPGELRAEALLKLGWAVAERDPAGLGAAAGVLRRARDASLRDTPLRGEAEIALAWARHRDGALREARAHAAEALRVARVLESCELEAHALAAVAFWNALTGAGDWRRPMTEALELEPEGARTWVLGRPRWLAAMVHLWGDDLEKAGAMFEGLRERAEEAGDVQAMTYLLPPLARKDLLTGDWARARQRMTNAAEIASDSGQLGQRLFVLTWSAVVEAHLGNVEATERLAHQVRNATAGDASYLREIELRSALGLLELSRAEPRAAWEQLSPLTGAIGDPIHHPGVLRFEGDAIEASIELGRLDDAERLLGSLERRAHETGSLWAGVATARSRGLLLAAEGELGAALSVLAVADERSQRLGYPYERARTLLALGRVLRRNRRWRAARGSLGAAREIFEGLGAALWSGLARAELERVGGRSPEPWGLTPTEVRLANLVAEGATNREAAAALSISVKTVEGNLTRIYRKLGVRSRAELTRRMLGDRQSTNA